MVRTWWFVWLTWCFSTTFSGGEKYAMFWNFIFKCSCPAGRAPCAGRGHFVTCECLAWGSRWSLAEAMLTSDMPVRGCGLKRGWYSFSGGGSNVLYRELSVRRVWRQKG